MTASTTPLPSPALDHIIERPRLIALLEEGDARVTLFAAPAGYGKTTLARQWSARQRGPVAWYRTTRASGDVAALAVRLDALLDRTAPQPRRDPGRIAAIASVNAHPLPLGRALVSTYAALGQDVLLVLDEWELAGTEEADELLGLLVDELDIRFLVTSRSPPPWFTSRLSVYGEGLEVGAAELAMTDEEALSVLSAVGSPKHPESLLATARGWPAVLGLAAMRSATELPTMPAETLYDYLASELVDSAAPDVQRGLELIAATTASEPAVVESLLGEATERILAEARRLGVVRVDEDSVLALHPLLRDLLLARLQKLGGGEREELVERFAPLVERRRWDEALAAAEAVPAAGFVSTALDRSLPDLLRAGRVATLRRWVAAGRTAGADHGLVDYADAEVAFREAAFDRAIAIGELAASSLAGDLAARAHLVAARAANLADRRERAQKHLAAAADMAVSLETSAAASWGMFLQALDEERRDAPQLLVEFEQRAIGRTEQIVRSAHGRIGLGLLDGGLQEHFSDAAVARTVFGQGIGPMIESGFLNIYAAAASLLGRYREAMEATTKELEIADEFEFEFVRRHALAARAKAAVGLRELSLAERALSELERRVGDEDDVFLRTNHAILKARLFLSLGDLERAQGPLSVTPDPRLNRATRGEHHALRGLVLGARGQLDDGLYALEEARRASRTVEVRCLTAVASAVIEVKSGSDRARPRALWRLCARLGGWDSLVTACRTSMEFAAEIANDRSTRDGLMGIVTAANDGPLARRLGVKLLRSGKRTDPLSPREREIHALIAQGMTNQEIARLLYISESTTKVHVHHILEKLGLRSRVEAARVWKDAEKL